MSGQLGYSMFQDVLFPRDHGAALTEGQQTLTLRRLKRYLPPLDLEIAQATIVVFDLETTGLDPTVDRIIEVGAQKIKNGVVVDQLEQLVSTDVILTDEISKLTGITRDMLAGQPTEDHVLPRFLQFIEGTILVAHNAEFDLSMVRAACSRLGLDLEWPCFCTLKMARELLPNLENRKLDTLAKHYGLTFEARHRAIGDIKVTAGVLQGLFANEAAALRRWSQLSPYTVS